MRQSGAPLLAKKVIDRFVAAFVLIVGSPVIALVAAAVALKLGWPVLFKQCRPGYKGRLFNVYKFRTMRDDYDRSGRLLPDAERLTDFGKFLRRTSLDELPQFWNLLKGDISLVGPRPLLIQYLDRYSPEQARRHNVLPGITGWAQVNGRNAVDWDERFRLDVWYVDNWSLLLDFKILLLTIRSVVRGHGISSEGHVTMYEFMGPGQGAPNGRAVPSPDRSSNQQSSR